MLARKVSNYYLVSFAVTANIFLLLASVTGLKMLKIKVPEYTERKKEVQLECEYDLENDRLYSISWYKDHDEFYRFVPKSIPPQLSYQVDGINVDRRHSDGKKVTLRNVNFGMSGFYRCEVSAEAPSFATVHADAHMEVIAIPDDGPKIWGEEKQYQIGDTIDLNCTSGKSYPPTKLHWFINDQMVKSTSEINASYQGLVSSMIRLVLIVGPEHFVDGQMRIRCLAKVTVGNHQHMQKSAASIQHSNAHPTSSIIDFQRDALISLKGQSTEMQQPSVLLLSCFVIIILFEVI